MARRGGNRPPYEEVYALTAWARSYPAWAFGQAALSGVDLDRLPATRTLDVLYCLVLADDTEQADRRDDLDSRLTNMGKPDPATWGLLPAHQRAMAAAENMGTGVQG